MTAAAVHPLHAVKALLADAALRGDSQLLAEALAGEHLPALGGHQHPAELLYQALALPPVDPEVISGVSRLLATLARQHAIDLTAPQPSALFNLLLLVSDLPAEAEIFAALNELHAAGIDDGAHRRQLRRALAVQQTDASLEETWLGLISAHPGEVQLSDDRKTGGLLAASASLPADDSEPFDPLELPLVHGQ